MDLREYVRSVLASWSEGEVVDTGPGEGEYRPPGHLACVVGDALAGIGVVTTAFTWQWTWQLLTPGVPGFVTTFLGVGSVLVLLGGALSTVAILFGEWAPAAFGEASE